jgi:ribose transport system substrate-binding protein
LTQAANPLLEQMAADGIPVIAFDSGVDSDIPITTAATDNVAAAALAADKMAELIGGSGQVGVIVHDQTSRTGIDRSEGFVNRMAEAYPDIEIIGPQYGGGDQLKSTDLAKAIIQANPDIKGFFAATRFAIGVVNAVNELDMAGDIVVIGYDSGIARIDAIRAASWPAPSSRIPSASEPSVSEPRPWPPGPRGPADHRHGLHLGRPLEHRSARGPGRPLRIGLTAFS